MLCLAPGPHLYSPRFSTITIIMTVSLGYLYKYVYMAALLSKSYKVSLNEMMHVQWVHQSWVWAIPRILDILILQDKTLSCACVDNFKQNGGFWCHCACADNFKQNGVFWRQHLPVVRVWTWPKYNKHHHDWKNQLCGLYRYVCT